MSKQFANWNVVELEYKINKSQLEFRLELLLLIFESSVTNFNFLIFFKNHF